MGLFQEFIDGFTFAPARGTIQIHPRLNTVQRVEQLPPSAYWNYQQILTVSYTGEKTPGEIGAVKRYEPDYFILRNRAWQSFIESETTTTITKKYVAWVIGTGLKLNSEPLNSIIRHAGLKEVDQQTRELIEDRWKMWVQLPSSDYKKVDSFRRQEAIGYKNALLGGDFLVILRSKKGNVTVQIIDADNVVTPPLTMQQGAKDEKNFIKNGIEQSPSGEHIAYWVQTKDSDKPYVRVFARGKKTKRKQAFLVYGNRYRLDNERGIPMMTAVLETLKKLDRYKEAAVGSAEEREKIPYFIKHDENSTGANPLTKRITEQLSDNGPDNSTFSGGSHVRDHIAHTTQKMVFNLEPGSSIEALKADTQLTFKDFYNTLVDSIASSHLMPPEVSRSKYDSNFSSARAAVKDWEHMLIVARQEYSEQLHQPIFEFWLVNQIASGQIPDPGLLKAMLKDDEILTKAFYNARWIGANVPHIDPLKEVKAAREKLGPEAKHLPLSTAEKETEGLNSGEFDQNVIRFNKEIGQVKKTEASEKKKGKKKN